MAQDDLCLCGRSRQLFLIISPNSTCPGALGGFLSFQSLDSHLRWTVVFIFRTAPGPPGACYRPAASSRRASADGSLGTSLPSPHLSPRPLLGVPVLPESPCPTLHQVPRPRTHQDAQGQPSGNEPGWPMMSVLCPGFPHVCI